MMSVDETSVWLKERSKKQRASRCWHLQLVLHQALEGLAGQLSIAVMLETFQKGSNE